MSGKIFLKREKAMGKKTLGKHDKVEEISVYDIEDFCIGHDVDTEAITGCTAVICTNYANMTGGSDVRGGAPGTRNLDTFKPHNGMSGCHAVVLSGGSYFGLTAAGGVEKLLEEKGIGVSFLSLTVPVVAQAILFDLAVGRSDVRPGVEMGYRAAVNAMKREKHPDGCVGAGIGATVGKICTMNEAMKSGLGTCAFKKGDLFVGAVIAVNALGDVVDPRTSEVIAGTLSRDGKKLVHAEDFILNNMSTEDFETFDIGNTTIGTIITNAKLSTAMAQKIAAWSHDGIARAVRPAHMMSDGDTMFCMSSCEVEAGMNIVGTLAVHAVEKAIVSAVKNATSLAGYVSCTDFAAQKA